MAWKHTRSNIRESDLYIVEADGSKMAASDACASAQEYKLGDGSRFFEINSDHYLWDAVGLRLLAKWAEELADDLDKNPS
jgi:hypothetical protein